MFFNSLTYAVFLPVVFSIYMVLGRTAQNRMLLAASYLFYGWWDSRFLFLITLSTAVDYCAGIFVAEGRLRFSDISKSVAWIAIAAILFLGGNFSALSTKSAQFFGVGAFLNLEIVLKALLFIVVACVFVSALYFLSLQKRNDTRRKYGVGFSVVTNLGILAIFKYYNFFIESLELAVTGFGFDPSFLRLDIVLPVGISFYTFQTISYSIDVYRGKCQPTRQFLDFALFVSYFPQLVAGPIERASHLLPMILNERQVSVNNISRGLFLITLGMFKKVGIADGLAPYVNSVFESSVTPTSGEVIVAVVAFAFQIYCDFSGYSDIARGTSKLFGINLVTNFKLPYFSTNPSEFWRRWHISLSSWLRDYLYIPLGGSKFGAFLTYRNLMLTMLLGGLWHGAGWNFILWGFYQGSILCIHRLRKGAQAPGQQTRLNFIKLLKISLFFAVICYGWLLFRAQSLEQVVTFTTSMFANPGLPHFNAAKPSLSAVLGLPLLLSVELVQYVTQNDHFYRRWHSTARGFLMASFIVIILIGLNNTPSEFIYFRF